MVHARSVREIEAAQGWLELGNPDEALSELEKVPANLRHREDVLRLRWLILHEQGNWEACKDLAVQLISFDSLCGEYWLWLARATRRASVDGIKEARRLLLRVHKGFADPIFPFNLACYDAQLGDLKSAKRWLNKAFERARALDESVVQTLAEWCARDEDLAPLGDEVRSLKDGIANSHSTEKCEAFSSG
jgi:tetratricopeptide (TPR) repeat protein